MENNQNHNKNKFTKYLKYILATIIPVSLITFSLASYGERPEFAVIKFIRGNKELWIDSQGKRYPGQEGARMQYIRDNLIVNGNSKTHAILKFFSKTNQDLNMFVKTVTHSQPSVYKFPCQIQGGSFLFGWKLTQNQSLPCQEITVQKGQPNRASKIPQSQFSSLFGLKQILFAQDWDVEYAYCSIVSDTGESWLKIKTGNPCTKIVEECEQTDANECNIISLGDWWTTEPEEMTATIQCANDQLFTAKGSANKIKKIAEGLYEEAIASGNTGCSLQLYRPEDLVVIPASAEELAELGQEGDEIIILSRDTEACPEIEVIYGGVTVKSANNLQGVQVKEGIKTNQNFCQQQQTESFDLESARNSIDMEILDAYNNGYEFCDEQQASGGTEGDRRTIQLTSNQGNIKIEYEMFDVPDALQLFYEGKGIYSTYNSAKNDRKVSDSDTIIVPFSGNSGRVEVVLTGNEDTGTKWEYTLSCPQ